MKKFALLLSVICLLAACCTAFADGSEPIYRIVKDRVIEVTYNEYNEEDGISYLESKYMPEMGGCSAVKVRLDGKTYVGRNYDFYCSDSPAFIVHNNWGKIRTIGIGNSPDTLPAWTDSYELSEEKLAVLPYICCDIMSEAGLFAETNIRVLEDSLRCEHTNPGAPRRCTQTFLLTMLSNYSTIDEIIAHVDDYDWYDLAKMGFEQSIFITDQSGRSVVFEFAANSWKVTESDYNGNYYINNEYYAQETLGCGELRNSKELAYRPFVRTPDDIFTMMEQGAYAQFYTAEVDPEYAMPEFYDEIGYDKNTAAANHEDAIAKTKALTEKYSHYTWEQMIESRCWESTFITVASLSDLTLNVHFSEHYGIEFTVAFE